MRLFAAVDPSPEAVALLAAVVPMGDQQLRYVPPEQWHVTLAFYGEVEPSSLPELTARLARAGTRTPALRLSVSGAGCFPLRSRLSRVLWCGLEGDIAALTLLAERTVAAGRRTGIPIEDRPFHPHLTIARARGRRLDMGAAVAALAGYTGPEWVADELHLVQSHLGPPTRHERVASFPLRGEVPAGRA